MSPGGFLLLSGVVLKKLRKPLVDLYLESLRDHLLRDRPRSRKALALPRRVRGRPQLLGKMRRPLSRHFRDYGVVDRVRHRDGRTSRQEVHGTNPRTAIPNDLRLEAEAVIVQPFWSPCVVISEAYNRAIGCSSKYRSKDCSIRHC